MAVSRYYRPRQQQYVSQFIPQNLQLMKNVLDRRQAQYDKTQSTLNTFKDNLLKMEALPKHDTEVLKQKRNEFDNFITNISKEDLGSSTTTQKVVDFINKFKNDKDLKKVALGVQLKKTHDKLEAEYRKTPDGYASVNDIFYNKYNEYANQKDKFAIDYIQGTEVFDKGVNVMNAIDKAFSGIPKSGLSKMKTIIDEYGNKAFYTDSWSGITSDKITEVANEKFNSFLLTSAGKQLYRTIARSNPNDDDKTLMAKTKQFFYTQGLSHAGVVHKNNKATAENSLYKQEHKNDPKQPNTLYQPGSSKFSKYTFNNKDELNSKIAELKNSNNPNDRLDGIKLENDKVALHKDFENSLTGKTKQLYNTDVTKFATPDKFKNERTMFVKARIGIIKQALVDAGVEEYVNTNDPIYGQIPDASSPDPDKFAIDMYNKHINDPKYKEKLSDAAKVALGEYIGIDYQNDVINKENDYIVKGYNNNSTDVFIDANSGKGKQILGNIKVNLHNIVDSKNFDVSANGNALESLPRNIDYETMHMNISRFGAIFEIKTKGEVINGVKHPPITIKITPKSKDLSHGSTTRALIAQLSGGENTPEFKATMKKMSYRDIVVTEKGVEPINIKSQIDQNQNPIVAPLKEYTFTINATGTNKPINDIKLMKKDYNVNMKGADGKDRTVTKEGIAIVFNNHSFRNIPELYNYLASIYGKSPIKESQGIMEDKEDAISHLKAALDLFYKVNPDVKKYIEMHKQNTGS